MDTKELTCFQRVYEEKSMNKAAKQLFISPQGLSKTIKNLEEELETVLFTRTKQGVIPTESAKILYVKSRDIMQEFSWIRNEMQQVSNQKKLLRIGCANGVFHVLPLNVILSFMEAHPEICVEWCEYSNEEVKQKLLSSQIEYGFTVGDEENTRFLQRKMISRRVKLLVYEGHPFYDLKSIRVDALKKEKLLIMNEHFQMYHEFITSCQLSGFYPQIVAKTLEGGVLMKLCSQRIGVAVIPDFLEEELKINHVRAIPFEETMTWDVYETMLIENKEFEAIRLFQDYLWDYIRESQK